MKQITVALLILAGIFYAVDYHTPGDQTVETFSLMFNFGRDVVRAVLM